MTYKVGDSDVTRHLFETTGVLDNTVGLGGLRQPSFAFAHDFGTVGTSRTTPVVYAIGHERDPLVQFSNVPNVNSTRRPYYLTRYDSTLGMVYKLCAPFVVVLTWHLVG